jgi:hypothetical protein
MKEVVARFLIASAAIPAILLGLSIFIFPLVYFLTPIFFPVSVYLNNTAAQWASIFVWSGAVGILFAWLSKSQPKLKSIGIYMFIVVAGSVLIHLTLHTLGHSFHMETP